MKCAKVKNLLLSYIDGGLNVRQNQQVKEHLVSCPYCRRDHEKWLDSIRVFQSLNESGDPPQPWEEFYFGLRQRIDNENKYMHFFQKISEKIKPYTELIWEKPMSVLVPAGICLWLAGVILVQLMPELGDRATEFALQMINRFGG